MIQITVEEVLSLLRFSEFTQKSTRAGERLVRNASISGAAKPFFWECYNRCKTQWAALGYSVTKFGSDWQVVQWLKTDGSITEQSLEATQRAKEEEADPNALPFDWTPDDVELETTQAQLLYPYQIPAVLRLKRALKNGNALDASDTGTGKTICALIAAAELGLTPCVIAPLSVLPPWRRAADAFRVPIAWAINYDKIRGGKTPLAKFTPQKVYDFTYLPAKPLLIFDEVHKCKSEKSLQGQLLRDAASAGHKILMLSATAAKDPTEMRNIGLALGLHDGSMIGWKDWSYKNGCKETPNGLKFKPGYNAKRYLDRIHRKIYPLRGNRTRIADLPEFPETQITAEMLDTGHTDFITAAYREMEDTLEKIASQTGVSGSEKAASGLAARMKARKASEKGKIKLFTELAKEAIEEGKSVAIFVNFRDHVEILMKELATDCVVWGGQHADERQANIDAFNTDQKHCIILTLAAGGAGLSLHDTIGNRARLSLISPSDSEKDLKQGLGRVHRAGAMTKSFQRIIFAAGTIEEEIGKNVGTKLANIDRLNDGDLAPQSVLQFLQNAKNE